MSELSTSIKDLQYDMRASAPNSDSRKWFFDTHAVVRVFEENGLPLLLFKKRITILIRSGAFSSYSGSFFHTGFTTQQAEVLVKSLGKITDSNMDIIYNDMVTKVQQVRLPCKLCIYCLFPERHSEETSGVGHVCSGGRGEQPHFFPYLITFTIVLTIKTNTLKTPLDV